jgi:hypothetical protein
VTVVLFLISSTQLFAQKEEEFDQYKLRISAFWFHSEPSGEFQSAGQRGFGIVDIHRDLGFDPFDTVAGKVDWRFARKHHFYFTVSPFSRTKTRTLDRSFTFQGQTFDLGLVTNSELLAHMFAPGYQYDIIRRRRGHLGVAVQFDLFDTDAKISAAAQTSNGVFRPARSVEGSLLAPIPVAGPEFRIYLTNSPRLFVEGNVYGMYFFGYGNFISSGGTLGVTLSKQLSVNGGYQLGSRLVVHNNSTDRIGLRLTQVGSLAGLQFSF